MAEGSTIKIKIIDLAETWRADCERLVHLIEQLCDDHKRSDEMKVCITAAAVKTECMGQMIQILENI